MDAISDSVVVFGGGGIWGVAWMAGLVMGLADEGVDLTHARAFIGTSAGSIIGSQIAHGYSPTELFARQMDPTRQPGGSPQPNDGLSQLIALMQRPWENPEARTTAVAELALNTQPSSLPESPADIAERLGVPSNEWPARELSVTAVDIATCELNVFHSQTGIGLIEAVAASCAVPGVRPPIRIQGRLYMDGDLWHNPENAHLARSERSVLVVSPFGARTPATPLSLHADVEDLRQSGSRVVLIAADNQALATLTPLGPLDPSVRTSAAEAGRAQGHREIEKLHAWIG